MNIKCVLGCAALASVTIGFSYPVYADQLGARYDQDIINGAGVLNGAVLNGAWVSSFAATYDDQLGVLDRPRPDYQAKGVPVGAFRLFPTIDLGLGYTDNVFYTETNARSDYFYSFEPGLKLESQWAEDSLVLYGGLQQLDYGKYDSQDVTDWHAGAATRIVVLRDTDVRSNIYYDVLHEPLASPNSVGNAAKPTVFGLFHADSAIDHKPDRFGVTIGGSLDNYAYDATPLVGGGERNNRDRNESIGTGFARGSYDFSPGYSAFFGASYNDRNFDLNLDRDGVNRDSSGYQVDTGVDMLITRLIRGQLFVGYQAQTYKTPLKDVRNMNYGADINWYATELLTVHLTATRAIDDTTVTGASATDDQTVSVGFDYEMLRDVIVQGSAGYTSSRFIGIVRHDTVPGAGLGIKWLINHNMNATLSYDFARRSTDSSGQDYSNNSVLFQLGLQL